MIFYRYFNNIAPIALIFAFMGIMSCDKKSASTNSTKINWSTSIEQGLSKAAKGGKIVMIDFWAEWCVACKELDATTYIAPQVASLVNQSFIPIKYDTTDMTKEQQELLQKYNIIGLPSIIFLDAKGTFLKDATVSGYVSVDEMLAALKQAQNSVNDSGQCKTC